MTIKKTFLFFLGLFFFLQMGVNTLPVPGALVSISFIPNQPRGLSSKSFPGDLKVDFFISASLITEYE